MSKAQVKTKYDAAANAATATVVFPVGDLKLKASCADNTFVPGSGASLRGVSFGSRSPAPSSSTTTCNPRLPGFSL